MGKEELVRAALAMGILVGGFILVGIADIVFIQLNENGTLSTTRPAIITVSSDWLEGETKTCEASDVLAQNHTPYVRCGEGPRHQINAAFYGPFPNTQFWNCTRGHDAEFSCRALSAKQVRCLSAPIYPNA